MPVQSSRKHHFIPAFYLKQWGLNEDELIAWSKPHDNIIAQRRHPNATGFQLDLNTFHELPGDIRTFLEDQFLKSADDDASRAFEKLLARDSSPWDIRLRSGWSRFLMSLPLRHPDTLEELKGLIKAILDGSSPAIQQRYEADRTPDMPASYKDYVYSKNEGGQARIVLHFVQGVMDNHHLGPFLNNLHWELLDLSRSSYRLLISDRPTQMMNVQNEKALVLLPMSPSLMFVAFRDPRIFQRLRNLDPNRVCKESNQFLVQRARRFVFSSDESQRDFIVSHMSTKMEQQPFFPRAASLIAA